MPSVDRVGRYFPLTLAHPLPNSANPLTTMSSAGTWFSAAETLVLNSLEDGFQLEHFDAETEALQLPVDSIPTPAQTAAGPGPHNNAWHLGLPASSQLESICPELSRQLLTELFFAYSLWWTSGSEQVQPSLLIAQGLPPMQGFAGLLDGRWGQWGWQERSLNGVWTASGPGSPGLPL